ncbi:hypothetical protein [Streptomyces gilvosporeus]|uniref:Uncharacterized protein n=1 Tax=Streptomyces gilvosporeus TaxID=553510 RepID=A0A1V0TUF0_9ACTN|nr:hypothetical protein [Streptomyces gilvosporeus]ARF56511.1 hypothetical protein B1H19_22135 [Streptomyces gilvosporeus]
MRDLTGRLLGRLALLLVPVRDSTGPRPTLIRWTERLFPANGRHRAAAVAPAPAPGSDARRRRIALPPHKSPYAQEATTDEPFEELPVSVRPYVLAPRTAIAITGLLIPTMPLP